MSRIAVISDIHGNMPALEAVLEDLAQVGPDEVLVGGDLVGRGPQGSLVAQRIQELDWSCVRGNHEDYVLSFRRDEVPDDWLGADEWSASRWMAAELSDQDVSFIASLPDSVVSEIDPTLRLVHGSPQSNREGLGPWCADEDLERHVDSVAESLLVCGHTHRPLVRNFPSGLLVNVGSVGLPFNGDTRAQYSVFTSEEGRWGHEPRQVEYPLEEILEIYDTSGFRTAGGVTADLLRMEVIHARPFLVPFLQWEQARGIPPATGHLGEFLEFYDPEEPIRSFFCRLRSISG